MGNVIFFLFFFNFQCFQNKDENSLIIEKNKKNIIDELQTNRENENIDLNDKNKNSALNIIEYKGEKTNEDFLKYSKNLNLIILNSFKLEKGFSILINPLGMVKNSLRKSKDGITYFGYVKNIENNRNNLIDFLIEPNGNYESKFVGRHFKIFYNQNDFKYYIQDCGNGYGTFLKIEKNAKIKNNSLISIGNSYLVCEVNSSENHVNNIIKIKIFSGIKEENIKFDYTFNSLEKQNIIIGRNFNCDIKIDDDLLSRINSTLIYKENEWFLYDGNYIKNPDSKSTNGTWIYLIEETEIYDNMIFKSNQNLWNCKLIEN